MICPRCKNRLTIVTVDKVAVDVCKGGCGGIWFDLKELDNFDEPHETAGEELLDIDLGLRRDVDYKARINCPRCKDVILMRHFSSVKREVEVDKCPKCGGYWLDYGELEQMRGLFKSTKDKDKAVEMYYEALFGPRLREMHAKEAAKLERARKFAGIVRGVSVRGFDF